jgi:hypothetical protein
MLLYFFRLGQPETHTLLPHKEAELARPAHGKFIAAISVSGDWMACAGGPAPSLW